MVHEMKNIQIIDSAENCEYAVFAASDEEFLELFPDGADVGFADEVFDRLPEDRADEIACSLWRRPVRLDEVIGIHGTLFYLYPEKKPYFPNRRFSDLAKSHGYRLMDR